MKIAFALLTALALSACGAKQVARPEPITVPVEVMVPVAQPCVPDALGPAPSYVDTKEALLAAGPISDMSAIVKRYQLLIAGRAQREARLNEVEPIIAGCPRGKSK